MPRRIFNRGIGTLDDLIDFVENPGDDIVTDSSPETIKKQWEDCVKNDKDVVIDVSIGDISGSLSKFTFRFDKNKQRISSRNIFTQFRRHNDD